LRKRISRAFSEGVSSAELFQQLTYMSALAASGLSRDNLFQHAATLPCAAAQFFARINDLVDNLQYDYPDACRLVGEKAREEDVRSFLLRFANALESGEPMDAFLATEASVQAEHYGNEYERQVESLRKWTDAFSSLVVSEVLILIINLVSTMLYDIGTVLMAALMALSAAIGLFGAWILSRAAPPETIATPAPFGSERQKLARRLAYISTIAMVVVCAVLAFMGVAWGINLVIAGLILMPVGILSFKCDAQIAKAEAEAGSFLRTLGGTATSSGTTLTAALGRIDLSSFPHLKEDAERLALRLSARISPALCWTRFGQDTGSQILCDSTRIFHDAVHLGADPDEVSGLCSMFTNKTSLLRAKRRAVAGTFSWLTLVMHGVLALLLIIVLEIVVQFRQVVESAMQPGEAENAVQSLNVPMMSFRGGKLGFLSDMTLVMLLLFCLVNAAAIILTEGGGKPKILLYLGAFLIMSGLSYLIGPQIIAGVMTM